MDKGCTLQVRRIEMFVGNTIYLSILLLSFIMADKVFFVLQIYLQLLFTSTSKHLCIRERNNPEDLSSHLLRGGSLK